MKVFVTGATGVIGRPTVLRLIEAGHEVRAVARREEAATALQNVGAEPVMVDLFDADAVRGAVVSGDAWLDESSPLQSAPGLLGPAIDGERIALELADGGGAAVVLRFGLVYGGIGNRGTDEMLRVARKRGSMIAGDRGGGVFRATTGWAPNYPSVREGYRAVHDQREASHA